MTALSLARRSCLSGFTRIPAPWFLVQHRLRRFVYGSGQLASDNSLSPFARFGLDAYAPTPVRGAPGLDAQACEKVYCGRGCLQVVAKVVIARST